MKLKSKLYVYANEPWLPQKQRPPLKVRLSNENIEKLFYNGDTAETNAEKVELLNLFFSNVYTDEDLSNILNVEKSLDVYNIICELRVTPQAVQEKLSHLNKSAGPIIIKELALQLSTPVCILLNMCFEQGQISTVDWNRSAARNLESYMSSLYKMWALTKSASLIGVHNNVSTTQCTTY